MRVLATAAITAMQGSHHTQLLYETAMDFLQYEISKAVRNIGKAARKLRV
jgi:hypothetical protein